MKITTILSLAIISAILITIVACSRSQGVEQVNKTKDGTAIKGFDTVAFFTLEKAIEGKPEYSFIWNGAKWFFSSAENRDMFAESPEKYAPQFGGYCSYAVSHGYTADGDPETFKIVDDKLYLNYNQKAKELWEKEQGKFIKEGEKNWVEFQKEKPEHK